ncbi:MAG: hypothetical protein GXC94_05380 [Comamonadaceae bacterium]|jgi:hypothetical protein|nr:hypothetical protein [Comamonadaceae bacterium]
MSQPFIPAKTDAARQLLAGPRNTLPAPLRMLLISVDGRRDAAQLQRIADSLKLGPDALERLHREGLIVGAVPATAPASGPPAADEGLRRLMRAKMFALDLAGRMLAGRDEALRASAREVDSESRFVAWLADASARIEAVADAERAQFFRERVAQAAG